MYIVDAANWLSIPCVHREATKILRSVLGVSDRTEESGTGVLPVYGILVYSS